MNRIFKYPLTVEYRQLVCAPEGAQFLSVAEQDAQLVLWASVSPAETLRHYVIRIATTGDEIPAEGLRFLGSAMLGKDGPWFVAHVFLQEDGKPDIVDHRNAEDFKQIKQELISEPAK